MTQGYHMDHSKSQRLLIHFFGNVLLEHVGLICFLPLAVHLFCAEQLEGVILNSLLLYGFYY